MGIKLKRKLYIPERDGLTQSLLSIYRTCQVKMRYTLDGYQKAKNSEALLFGSVFHKVLEFIYTEIRNFNLVNYEDIKTYIRSKSRFIYSDVLKEYSGVSTSVKEIVENSINTTLIMVPLYFRYYKEDFSIKWLAFEEVFKIKIGDIYYRGKRDAEFFQSDNSLWLFETKTKQRYNADFIIMWISQQAQFNIYLLSLYYKYKIVPAGAVYNMIRRPASPYVKRKRESWNEYKERLQTDIINRPEFYFHRITRSVDFKKVLAYKEKLIEETKGFIEWFYKNRKYDMPNGSMCESRYGACEFIRACVYNEYEMLEKTNDLFIELK